jgi:hypothetical protein
MRHDPHHDFMMTIVWPWDFFLIRTLQWLPLSVLEWLRPVSRYFRMAHGCKLCGYAIALAYWRHCHQQWLEEEEGRR